jgi:hypothetical protein
MAEIREEARSRVDAELGADRDIENERTGRKATAAGATGALGPATPGRTESSLAPRPIVALGLEQPPIDDISTDANLRRLLAGLKRLGFTVTRR